MRQKAAYDLFIEDLRLAIVPSSSFSVPVICSSREREGIAIPVSAKAG
jgi:hypothetical protein